MQAPYRIKVVFTVSLQTSFVSVSYNNSPWRKTITKTSASNIGDKVYQNGHQLFIYCQQYDHLYREYYSSPRNVGVCINWCILFCQIQEISVFQNVSCETFQQAFLYNKSWLSLKLSNHYYMSFEGLLSLNIYDRCRFYHLAHGTNLFMS